MSLKTKNITKNDDSITNKQQTQTPNNHKNKVNNKLNKVKQQIKQQGVEKDKNVNNQEIIKQMIK